MYKNQQGVICLFIHHGMRGDEDIDAEWIYLIISSIYGQFSADGT